MACDDDKPLAAAARPPPLAPPIAADPIASVPPAPAPAPRGTDERAGAVGEVLVVTPPLSSEKGEGGRRQVVSW